MQAYQRKTEKFFVSEENRFYKIGYCVALDIQGLFNRHFALILIFKLDIRQLFCLVSVGKSINFMAILFVKPALPNHT